MDDLLRVFHERIRLPDADVIPGWVRETSGLVHRSYPPDPGPNACGFIESPRGLGEDPDKVIAEQRDFYAGMGMNVEWKTYDYDEPADLGARLTDAGFVPDEPETLILGHVDAVLAMPSALPSKIVLRDVHESADFRRIAELEADIWGSNRDNVHEQLATEQREFPDRLIVTVVEEVFGGPGAHCWLGAAPPGHWFREPLGWRDAAGVAAEGAVPGCTHAPGQARQGPRVRLLASGRV
ncbi:GNAT family N-acetyltransferase [Kribbella sp. NBC_01245]